MKLAAFASSFGLLFVIALATPCQCFAQVVFENNFDQHATERVYTDDDLDDDFDEPRWNNGVTEGRVSIVRGSEAFGGTGSALAVAYPANLHGTSGGGAQWQYDLPDDYEELYLSYRVKFESGFDFVRGGKLPGLAGGSAPTGSNQATGTNGWSGRFMWRTDFKGVSGVPEQNVAEWISYAKYTDSGADGSGRDSDRAYWVESDGSRSVLNSDVWYTLSQRVKMNDPGQRNGILQIWLDGRLVHDQQNVLFRTENTFSIDKMYFSTFFGGGSSWRTSKDEIAYFDDFKVGLTVADIDLDSGPSTLKVPEDFLTVQEAINAASAGDTVEFRGFVRENIVVNKAISLFGFDDARIHARNRNHPVIRIASDDVHVKGFDLRFGPHAVVADANLSGVNIESIIAIGNSAAGIRLNEGCDGAVLQNNGVYYGDSDGFLIDRCDDVTFVNNGAYRLDGDGFLIFGSRRITIEHNTAFRNRAGFVIDGDRLTIEDNFAFANTATAFEISGDDHDVIDNYSRFSGSHGYLFVNASSNTIRGNVSREDSGNGFEFSTISDDNVLVDNIARLGDGTGFHFSFSSDNSVDNAASLENRSGFVLVGSASSNTFINSRALDNPVYGVLDQGSNNSTAGIFLRRNGND